MVYQHFVENGRVVYFPDGPDKGKLAAIVDIVDQNRALVDGPCSNVRRKVVNFKALQLTKFKIKVLRGQRTKNIKKAWEEAKINEEWEKTTWAKKLRQRSLRAEMTDFDRFKLMKAKQMRNRLVRVEAAKLKKAQKSK